MAAFLATRTKQELVEEAIRRKILLAPIATVQDILNSPHHAARDFFQNVDEDGMPLRLPGPFAYPMSPVSAAPFVQLTAAPTLGQHNHAVYAQTCGLSNAQVDAMAAQGVV